MQDANLPAKRPPDNEQRFDQHGQVGKVLDRSLMRASNSADGDGLRLVSSIRSF
jgi:hypothetical protein